MRKPWEAPDLRHLQRLHENKATKNAACALAEALVPEGCARGELDELFSLDILESLIIDREGFLQWFQTPLKARQWKKAQT